MSSQASAAGPQTNEELGLKVLERMCIEGRYKLSKKIGRGAFGIVYSGRDIAFLQEHAFKIESQDIERPQLEHEARVYQKLKRGVGIPRVYWQGNACKYRVLVLDLLGPSLEDVMHQRREQFSLSEMVNLADQLLCRLEYIHAQNVIHRDIKPANLLMGTGPTSDTLHLVDFGLAIPCFDSATGKHFREYAANNTIVGTPQYASLNAHRGVRLSRRDDLESATYVLLHLSAGSLPWSDLIGAYKNYRDLVGDRKRTCDIPAFCAEFGVPVEFAVAIAYARQLEYAESPDYEHVRKVYRRCLQVQKNSTEDYVELPTPTKEVIRRSSPSLTADHGTTLGPCPRVKVPQTPSPKRGSRGKSRSSRSCTPQSDRVLRSRRLNGV